MNVAARLPELAAEHGDRSAFIERDPAHGQHAIGFRALDDATARGAALLARHGLGVGDRVLLMVPLSIELYVALLSVLRIGGAAMLIDPGAGRAFLRNACAIAPPSAMIGSTKAQLLRVLHRPIRRIQRHVVVTPPWLPTVLVRALGIPWRAADALEPQRAIHDANDDEPALVTFTSGSTGLPKCAVRSHGLLRAQDSALRHAMADPPGSANLVTLPVFALTNLSGGVTSVLAAADLRRPAELDPEPLRRQIRTNAIESVVIAPAPLRRLLGMDDAQSSPESLTSFASIKRVFTGGGPVFLDVADGARSLLHRVAPDCRLTLLYGSTEAEPIAEIDLDDISDDDRRRVVDGAGLPAGILVDAITLRIISDHWGTPLGTLSATEFESLQRPHGAVGEIVVTGAHVLKGYLGGHGDEETKFEVDGVRWHRTGDAGHLDAHGRLWLAGRCAARIDDDDGDDGDDGDDDGTTYPLQIEAAAHAALPPRTVRRAALLAHDGRRVLFIEPEPGADRRTFDRLPALLPWAHLDRVIPIDRIPVDRRHNSKVDYAALRRKMPADS